MKSKLLFCLLLITSISCFANIPAIDTLKKHQARPVKKPLLIDKPHVTIPREAIKGYKKQFDNCVYNKQYTVSQRLKIYPFSAAVKILAVSYFNEPSPAPDIKIDGQPDISDTLTCQEVQKLSGMLIKKNRLIYSSLIEFKTLNRAQINRLTNIISNYEYNGMKDYKIISHASCFEPRNSLVFLDSKGKVIDHLDICFHCHNYESQSNKINVGTECTQKFDMLARFFLSIDVPYGTTE